MKLNEADVDTCKVYLSQGGEIPLSSLYIEVNHYTGEKLIGFFDERGRQMRFLIDDDAMFAKCLLYLEEIGTKSYTTRELVALEKKQGT